MRKNLFALGLLALSFSLNGQILTYVGDGGLVYVSSNTLVYSGGTVQTVGTGQIDNSGNVMIDQGGGFYTKAADGTTDKVETDTHENFILRLTDKATYAEYGQLWIDTDSQSLIKGYVDKEYLDNDNGTYQQMALPFNQKTFNTLSAELGTTLSQSRWSQNEILAYNQAMVRADNIPIYNKTNNSHLNNKGARFSTMPTSYYMVGAAGFNANDASAFTGNVFTIHGIPYASGISKIMSGAGANINFGTNGTATNFYRESFRFYLQDAFAVADGEIWTGNFGKNLYQYGNPFLTNLDLSQIGIAETVTTDDGVTITNILGVRFESEGVVTKSTGGTKSTTPNYITYTSGVIDDVYVGGVAVGDVDKAIIKPMQTFVIKLRDASASTINFDNLRRFSNTARDAGTDYSVTANKLAKSAKSVSSSTVKQLGVIGLDADGNEVARTYYVVYQDAFTGQPTGASTQAAASSSNEIGTFEETAEGGIDTNLEDTYWLYINEANEIDYKGKEIPLRIYSDEIKSLKFEIRENSKLINDNSTLTNGESFYLLDSAIGQAVAVNQGDVLSIGSTQLGLYYGTPTTQVLDVIDGDLDKPSETVVVFDSSDEHYKVLFDKTWNKAHMTVYDMAGRLVLDEKDVNTENNYILNLPNDNTAYIISAVSETGKKFKQKIKN